MKRIAIFASGTGSNAKNIINYFSEKPEIKIECIICNNPKAKVIEVAKENNIQLYLITKKDLFDSESVVEILRQRKIDLVVLAGFLWKIPESMLTSFPNKIINIHPALLPKYGGAGMYGMRVHKAVIAAREKETGITIHYLNNHYDEGEIILQKKTSIDENDSAETIAHKVHLLEFDWLPQIIEEILS
ncbi:MAG: phosphoribosylglycinamide formyltransferase [Chitinophagales bacterium]|nr:phosphoribosylglycinamide formyltransferase [Chitinophagales bacterium]